MKPRGINLWPCSPFFFNHWSELFPNRDPKAGVRNEPLHPYRLVITSQFYVLAQKLHFPSCQGSYFSTFWLKRLHFFLLQNRSVHLILKNAQTASWVWWSEYNQQVYSCLFHLCSELFSCDEVSKKVWLSQVYVKIDVYFC